MIHITLTSSELVIDELFNVHVFVDLVLKEELAQSVLAAIRHLQKADVNMVIV